MSQMHPPPASSSHVRAARKEIPPRFWQCDTEDLTILIADMIMQLIEHNDKLPLTPSGLTRFHSRAPPAISVHDYLSRIVRYTSLERTSLLSTVIYIDRLCAAFPAFVISSLTIHRYLITATTVASKGLCDTFCTNTHYAKVGGISLGELNVLELEILARMDWRILCPENELQAFYMNMAANNPKYDRLMGEDECKLEESKVDLKTILASKHSAVESGAGHTTHFDTDVHMRSSMNNSVHPDK